MDVSFRALVLVAVVVAAMWLTYRLIVRHPLDAAALTLYFLSLDFVLRPLVLALGLDRPFPTEILGDVRITTLLARSTPFVLLWLGAMVLGHTLVPSGRDPRASVLRAPLDLDVMRRTSTVLGVAALALTAVLVVREGSIGSFTRATKIERSIRGDLRVPALLATTFAAATYLMLRLAGDRPVRQRRRMFILTVAAATMAYLWGARDAAVFGAIALLVGVVYYSADRDPLAVATWWRARGVTSKLLVGLAVCVGLTVGLRIVRDHVLYNEVRDSIRGQTVVRQVAVGTNNTTYDALSLALRTWPDERPFADGTDFVRGSINMLPSFVTGPTDPYVSPSLQLAKYYVPNRESGWPMTAMGEWYVNLGAFGVFVGGVVSGAVVGLLQRRFRDIAVSPLSWVMTAVLVGRVFPGGVWSNSLNRFVILGIPMLLVAALVEHRSAAVARAAPALGSLRASPTGRVR